MDTPYEFRGKEVTQGPEKGRNDPLATDIIMSGVDFIEEKHVPCEVDGVVFQAWRCQDQSSFLHMSATQRQQPQQEFDQRRSAKAQLRESEKRLHMALNAASIGVWDCNLVTGEICQNTEHSFESHLHPDDREKVLAEREAYVQGRIPGYEVEYRIRDSETGGWRWMLSRGQAVARDELGKAQRIIGTTTDITRLKMAEADLKNAQAKLKQRLKQQTVQLSELNVALTVLLQRRQEDRATLAEQILANTVTLIEPFLDRLSETRLTENQQALVEILRTNIKELIAPFANNLSSKLNRLTPAEIQVANLVKLGKRSKEIAQILHLSPGTVNIHRKNIRKKLEISHQKANLQTVLSDNS